ncbi:outer membrane protein assembly factor BamD [Balneolales bacterium ANBcel1]|nr:outer membrane protein assembly factor BamD [Balneolales bacterium ANBcel1]
MPNIIKLITLLLVLVTIASCGSRQAIKPGDTLEVAFEKAMGFYDRERYSQAVDAFETVLSIARGTALAADAQYYLAKSHYQNRSFLLAASEFRRFARNYTTDERRMEAEFLEAYSHYRMSPRFNLDQTETYNALSRFQLFITRYPDSEFAEEAAGYMDELRDKLAKKMFHAAEMYFRIGQYESAAIYYGLTVDNYPESQWAEKALANRILAYVEYAENSVRARQQERFEKAVESYESYVQIFPRGPNRPEAEEHYNRALDGLAELATITAGR